MKTKLWQLAQHETAKRQHLFNRALLTDELIEQTNWNTTDAIDSELSKLRAENLKCDLDMVNHFIV